MLSLYNLKKYYLWSKLLSFRNYSISRLNYFHIYCMLVKNITCGKLKKYIYIKQLRYFGNVVAKLLARLLATTTRCASSFYATEQDKCAETRRFAKLWKLSSGITVKRPSLVRKLRNVVWSVNPSADRENFVKYYLVDISQRKCRRSALQFWKVTRKYEADKFMKHL